MLPRLHPSQSVQQMRTSDDASLNEAKKRKKQLELESQNIQNRINQLAHENEKLSKRVDIAEQLALDVYAQRLAQKIKKEQKQNQLSTVDPTKYQKTQYERMHLKQMKQDIKEMKKSDAQVMKQSLRYELMRTNEEKTQYNKSLKLKAALKKEEEKLSQALIQEKLYEKQQKVRLEQEREKQKILMENEQYEMFIKQLEANEIKLVEKLQETQQREQAVKEKLMAATRLAPEEFDKTYLGGQSIVEEKHAETGEEEKKNEKVEEEQKEKEQEQEKSGEDGGQQGTQTD